MTSIAGELSTFGRAAPMRPPQAILATHKDATYVIWGGHRSRIDPMDRSVTFNLGLDPGVTHPIEISNALYDAMPSTEPLVVPPIPEAGRRRGGCPRDRGQRAGNPRRRRYGHRFYVLLPDGVQKITSFVADLLRTANPVGSATPTLITPDKLIHIPTVDVLNVDYYPPGKLDFIDTAANPVTCVAWQKQSSDPQASITIFSGRVCRFRSAWTLGWCIWCATTVIPNRWRLTKRCCCRARPTSWRRRVVWRPPTAGKACTGCHRKVFATGSNRITGPCKRWDWIRAAPCRRHGRLCARLRPGRRSAARVRW
ncbi:hypothetical protein I552_8422 [Mycobacterium xenopi 3993]|nr:hypothetical protein I552_8422 [Mycobacterium xenopi 3993]